MSREIDRMGGIALLTGSVSILTGALLLPTPSDTISFWCAAGEPVRRVLESAG